MGNNFGEDPTRLFNHCWDRTFTERAKWIGLDDRGQGRDIRAGSNFVSQDPTEALFGLSRARFVRPLRGAWPNGEQGASLDSARIAGGGRTSPPVPGPRCRAPGENSYGGGKERGRRN